ncbi:unnamed protein product [Blepharisma stoltei]|uniref:Uncharacterized protein n=1 Tax=Blepharisma stoltei TaxID=1481888 RepID=A0AAU9K514_9CILI|nr:unnamed protein product [Blepharisma stoltei]
MVTFLWFRSSDRHHSFTFYDYEAWFTWEFIWASQINNLKGHTYLWLVPREYKGLWFITSILQQRRSL